MEKQRDVNRVMTPVVQTRMITGYEACNLEHGPGMYERMKSHMSRHVDTTKSVMFNDASEQLLVQLDMLQVPVSHWSLMLFPHYKDQTQRRNSFPLHSSSYLKRL